MVKFEPVSKIFPVLVFLILFQSLLSINTSVLQKSLHCFLIVNSNYNLTTYRDVLYGVWEC